MRKSWHHYFMEMAEQVATRSKDPSTKVGCVVVTDSKIVAGSGYNGIPRGVADLEVRMERPAKYLWTSHAEENAVAQAARLGMRLENSSIYTTNIPCARCARMLIQAGVTTIYAKNNSTKMDTEEFAVARKMLTEAGVMMIILGQEDE
jgi:dCMP deaminase